jgi:hypothetical protein
MPGKGRPFVKGDPRAGRRKAGKNKKWRSIDTWGERLSEAFGQLKPQEQAECCIEMLKMMMTYRALASQTPEQSKEKAAIMAAHLADLSEPIEPADTNPTA